jgi:hypothetical protein
MKKELQKRRGILLAFLGFLCVVGVQAQTWTAPVPDGSVITDAAQYYVYNVGTKAFLDHGGEWDSQTIVTPSTGSLITTAQSGSLWKLQYESNTKCLKYDYPGSAGWVFSDGSVRNNLNVQLADVATNTYSIQLPDTSIAYNVNEFLGTSATLYSSNREGTVYDVRYNRAASDYTKWMFVTADALAKYNAKVQLDNYMNIAKLVGSSVDLTSYIATYNAGITADINTAVTNLKAALTVTDKTSSITNADFAASPATGWTGASYGYSNGVAEFWHQNNKSLSQTVTGLPAGVYVVKFQGYQRPVGLNTAQRTNYTNGFDVLCGKMSVTASGTTTFIPVRSIYSETTCPAGTAVDGLKFPNSTGDAKAAFDLGLYENELGYVTVDGTGSITLAWNVYYQGVTGDWHAVDNFRLYYYGAVVPPVTTSVKTASELSKSNIYMKGNAIVADFELAQSSNVEISVFNAQGMLLNKTVGSFNAGKNSKEVDVNLASGLYLVKLAQNGKSITTKVIK